MIEERKGEIKNDCFGNRSRAGDCGYGVIQSEEMRMRLIDYGTILTPAGLKLPERLDIIYDSMLKLIDRFSPDAIAFEELFFAKNVKTGIAVAHAAACLWRQLISGRGSYTNIPPCK